MIDFELPVVGFLKWRRAELMSGWSTRLTCVGMVRLERSRSSIDPVWTCAPAKGGVALACLWSLFCACDVLMCLGSMACALSGAPTLGGRAVVGLCGRVGSLLGHRRCPIRASQQLAPALSGFCWFSVLNSNFFRHSFVPKSVFRVVPCPSWMRCRVDLESHFVSHVPCIIFARIVGPRCCERYLG